MFLFDAVFCDSPTRPQAALAAAKHEAGITEKELLVSGPAFGLEFQVRAPVCAPAHTGLRSTECRVCVVHAWLSAVMLLCFFVGLGGPSGCAADMA